MIKSREEFLEVINNRVLKPYKVRLHSIGEIDNPYVLAYFDTKEKTISINKHNKLIFNDYVRFVSVMQHENIHLMNDLLGVEDVYMDNGVQVHNNAFKARMLEKYGWFIDKENKEGNIDYSRQENKASFDKVVRQSLEDKDLFLELQKYYLENIYEPLPQQEEQQEKEEEKQQQEPPKSNEQEKQESNKRQEEQQEQEEENQQPNEYVWEEEEGEEF